MVQQLDRIAAHFAAYRQQRAEDEVATHIRKFRAPRLREQFINHSGEGLHPLAQAAAARLR